MIISSDSYAPPTGRLYTELTDGMGAVLRQHHSGTSITAAGFDFDPHEPRDEHGRWVDVPGSSSLEIPSIKELMSTPDNYLTEQAGRIYGGTFGNVGESGPFTTQVMWAKKDPDGITIAGQVLDNTGVRSGSFDRQLEDHGDGWGAHHEFLRLAPEHRGQGFARDFNGHLESWYRANDVDRITLYADLSVGGYAWARQGYDWADEDGPDTVMGRMMREIGHLRGHDPAQVEAGSRFLDRWKTMTFGKDDYPTPYDVSVVGYVRGLESWIGKLALLSSDWNGVKWLR